MKMFRKLLTLEEAQKAISSMKLAAPGTEGAPLLTVYNRVLVEEVTSSIDIPPFDRSTVDGYAVKAADTFSAEENQPVQLSVGGVVNIGELPKISVSKGEAAEIVTGAPIPEGADAIVMVEDTERTDIELRVFNPVTKGENVMKKGSDIKKGETVLKGGQVLRSREIGVLAALGAASAKVYRVPRVAVLSTGGEVTEPGKELPPGKIYDINAYSLCGAVLESGGKPIYLGVAPDEMEKMREAFVKALESADMVVTSGGVSVGPKDITPQTVDSLGEPGLIFSGIAVKPGKPTTMALIGRKPVFALPGHPTSALLMFQLLVRPVIWRLAGMVKREGSTVKAVAGRRMFSAKGRRTFVMVTLRKDKNGLVAETLEMSASGAITTLAKADGYVEIPENQQFVDKDEQVEVTLF